MDWLDTRTPAGRAAPCLVACAALGWFAPRLIARLPEPEPRARAEPEPRRRRAGDGRRARPTAGEPQAVRAQRCRRRRPRSSTPTSRPCPHLGRLDRRRRPALVGASFGAGARAGPARCSTSCRSCPIGVVLMVIDWRTTLLPTRIIHPTYVLLAVLIPLAALVDHDLDALYRAGWGWLVIGGWFWIFWWLFNAWGFGDVRLVAGARPRPRLPGLVADADGPGPDGRSSAASVALVLGIADREPARDASPTARSCWSGRAARGRSSGRGSARSLGY